MRNLIRFYQEGWKNQLINQTFEGCEPVECKNDNDSDSDEPIWRIASINMSYPVVQETIKPVEVEREHLYSASAIQIDEKKSELKDLPHHLEYAYLHGDKSFPITISSELSKKEKISLLQVLEKRKGAIAWKMLDIKGISPSYCTHKILMEDDFKPIIQPQRRLNPKMLESLCGNEYYCFLDGFLGFFQIPIAPKDQEKTTFTCPYGTFAYRMMPFGLCNAPATFQRCMTAIFHDMVEDFMKLFMDDFSVFGNSFDCCLANLDRMLARCEETNLMLNWEKYRFMVIEWIVLGHKILGAGFFWPSIFKDAKDYVVRGDACQRSGNISSRSEIPQNNIQIEHKAYWALTQCNMDLTAAAKNCFMELNELMELRDGAYENTRIYKERTKRWHDSRLRGDKNFKVGDKNLKSRWYDPNVVKTVYPYETVEISDKNGISFKVNGQRLKKYHDGHIDAEDKEVVEFKEDTS
ncbi:reverse transcriptase domain-containing protein [Tanacetum coccineum]